MLTGHRRFSRISQPIPPCALAEPELPKTAYCAHAEDLTGTPLRAQFLQVEKINSEKTDTFLGGGIYGASSGEPCGENDILDRKGTPFVLPLLKNST